MIIDKNLIEEMDKVVKKLVKSSRYNHSVRTAETVEKICRMYNYDPEIGYFTGLVHDICKEFTTEEMLSLAMLDGLPISDIETEKKSLLHGRAGAMFLKQNYGVENNEILEAVRYHTFGKENLGILGKIVYVADKIEPGRPQVTKEYTENLLKKNINELVIAVVEENIEYLHKEGKRVMPQTEIFLHSLIQEVEQNVKS